MSSILHEHLPSLVLYLSLLMPRIKSKKFSVRRFNVLAWEPYKTKGTTKMLLAVNIVPCNDLSDLDIDSTVDSNTVISAKWGLKAYCAKILFSTDHEKEAERVLLKLENLIESKSMNFWDTDGVVMDDCANELAKICDPDYCRERTPQSLKTLLQKRVKEIKITNSCNLSKATACSSATVVQTTPTHVAADQMSPMRTSQRAAFEFQAAEIKHIRESQDKILALLETMNQNQANIQKQMILFNKRQDSMENLIRARLQKPVEHSDFISPIRSQCTPMIPCGPRTPCVSMKRLALDQCPDDSAQSSKKVKSTGRKDYELQEVNQELKQELLEGLRDEIQELDKTTHNKLLRSLVYLRYGNNSLCVRLPAEAGARKDSDADALASGRILLSRTEVDTILSIARETFPKTLLTNRMARTRLAKCVENWRAYEQQHNNTLAAADIP